MYASLSRPAAEETVTFFHVSDERELSLFLNRELPPGNHSTQLAAIAFCGQVISGARLSLVIVFVSTVS
jgi:hypothetical protein